MSNKKKVVKIVLTICLVMLVLSQNITAFETESKKTTIKVGYDKSYGVISDYSSLDSKGFGYEILERAQHYSDYTFEFYEYEYWEALSALEKGEIDVMGVVFDSDLHRKRFTYVPTSLGTAQLVLATKNTDAYYDDPKSLDGKTVATFENNPYEVYLDNYCKENNQP